MRWSVQEGWGGGQRPKHDPADQKHSTAARVLCESRVRGLLENLRERMLISAADLPSATRARWYARKFNETKIRGPLAVTARRNASRAGPKVQFGAQSLQRSVSSCCGPRVRGMLSWRRVERETLVGHFLKSAFLSLRLQTKHMGVAEMADGSRAEIADSIYLRATR